MEYNGNEMLQGTGHPAEIQEFYSRFSAGCLNLFLVAKSVRLVMIIDIEARWPHG